MKQFLILFIVLSNLPIPIGFEIIQKNNMPKMGSSCTIFTVSIGKTVLFGNNEDWLKRDIYQWYVPSQDISVMGETKTIYGGVFVGFENPEDTNGIYPQGGMNEHGLFYDFNGLPALAINQNSTGMSFYSDFLLCTSLWDCKNVTEIIKWYKNHKWDLQMGGQIHYGDASGDAVVISVNPYTNEWAFTRKKSNYIVSTNFNLNNTSNANYYPCERYNTAMEMLNKIENEENLTVQVCADILYAVHQEGEYSTIYSNIFDPVNLDVYFNYGKSYQKQKKTNLLDTMSQNASFEKKDSFFGITGIDGHLLVKSVRVNNNFYYPHTNTIFTTFIILGFLAFSSIGVLIVVYIYKKKEK